MRYVDIELRGVEVKMQIKRAVSKYCLIIYNAYIVAELALKWVKLNIKWAKIGGLRLYKEDGLIQRRIVQHVARGYIILVLMRDDGEFLKCI